MSSVKYAPGSRMLFEDTKLNIEMAERPLLFLGREYANVYWWGRVIDICSRREEYANIYNLEGGR